MQEQHKPKQMAGRYVPTFSWPGSIEKFVNHIITESPLLHVCAGPQSQIGDVRVDRHVTPHAPAVKADWLALPFKDDSFGAVFADPPWGIGYMADSAKFCEEALRIARVIYVMSPWLWVAKGIRRKVWIREFPGINNPILIARYERGGYQMKLLDS
jgi:hypothetical protein